MNQSVCPCATPKHHSFFVYPLICLRILVCCLAPKYLSGRRAAWLVSLLSAPPLLLSPNPSGDLFQYFKHASFLLSFLPFLLWCSLLIITNWSTHDWAGEKQQAVNHDFTYLILNKSVIASRKRREESTYKVFELGLGLILLSIGWRARSQPC